MLSYKALKVVSNYETLILVSYSIRSSFAIPVHKTCEDSHDKGVQFVLEATPQHQTSKDCIFLYSQGESRFCSKQGKEWKS